MEIKNRAGVAVLQPEGDLTIFEAADFRDALLTLLEHEGPVELDLAGVERVDSSGIQMLVAAARQDRFSVTGMSSAVNEKVASIGCAHFLLKKEP
ncbi:MAG: STAS domain-containing protein [Nitrospirales bacterium]|nr:STAS domain-containing protein [Nitrospira sp.]MDR4502296.1 STAS domain-containing protein [Nitrospirales bacterium]